MKTRIKPGRLQKCLLFIGITLLAACLYLWLSLFSSLGYEVPAQSLALEPGQQHQLFVYGTLRHPLIRTLVIRRQVATRPASLPGFKRQGLDLSPADDQVVKGELLTVNSRELLRLDRYERLGIRYERIRLTLEDGQRAWVYQRMH